MAIATGAAIALAVAGAASAGASAYGAKKQAGAAKYAADVQTEAANKAAAIQAGTSKEALDFQKQQAAADQARYEASQRANYAQYLQKYAAVKGLGGQLGVNLPEASGYDAALGGAAGGGAGAGAAGADPKALAVIRDYQAKNPASAGPAGVIAALKAQGIEASPYLYGQTPSGNEIDLPGYGKFKVLSEGSNTWYTGGDDSAPGAGLGPSGAGSYLPTSIGSYVPPTVAELQRPEAFRLGPRTKAS